MKEQEEEKYPTQLSKTIKVTQTVIYLKQTSPILFFCAGFRDYR